MRSKIILGAAGVMLAGYALAAEELPIMAWGWPFEVQQQEFTAERLLELRDAGFNHVLQWAPDAKVALRVLDLAQKMHVKVLLHYHDNLKPSEAQINAVKDHPALYAYYVTDEPTPAKCAEIGPAVTRLQKLDPGHFAYINSLGLCECDGQKDGYGVPDGDFKKYLASFFANFDWKVMRFDMYPVFTAQLCENNDFRRPKGPIHIWDKWFPTLEIFRDESQKRGIPFWAFVCCCAIRNHPKYDNPLPTVGHMKVQAYGNLAYGAQGLEYYKYRLRDNVSYNFAPLDRNLKRTPVYDRVRTVNRELQARAKCFVGSKSVRVRHIGNAIPDTCVKFDAEKDLPSWATDLTTDRDALVAVLEKGGRQILVVVNTDMNDELTLKASFKPGVKRVLTDGTTVDPDLYCGQFWLNSGDAEIFVGPKE